MPDFDVGNSQLQTLLEWVDQPPPPQGRDTHAIFFELQQTTGGPTPPLLYWGLMFFHPGNPHQPIFQRQPGLSGTGGLVDNFETENRPFWVRVEVRFRPPNTFGFLRFIRGGGEVLPSIEVRSVEMDEVRVSGGDPLDLRIHLEASTESWTLHTLKKTTVLLSIP